ncbi:ABC transporter substrate-binding protein [Microbacterium esteraromaticum]|uniref:ABC transporter substrate-binding protein n=1 Tax=Microbacterium esteraromaticum TaxID=57043 RepID=UPI00195B0FE2|nr:ABC transporter substrate-binding protein [Microbacterium esteraromaticum]MBM7465540.1 peptide/nickel transport system substrate-binding protein [Microbacterium esteraromaticum]
MARRRILTAAAAAAAVLLITSGCSTSGSDAATSEGEPVKGGVLKVLANGDVDHLDPQLVAYVPVYSFMRAMSRSLLSYAASDDAEERITLQPDLATEVPEPSADGLKYTITLRDGTTWGAPDGARAIVSSDVERGFKRLCNPLISGALSGYFIDLIEGMSAFCTDFSKIAPEVEPMKEFIEGNDISGIATPDDKTIEFTLTKPASDFPFMLSLDAADPAPVEALEYLPDSPEYRKAFVSSGPYKVKEYSPDAKFVLERNDAWDPKSDPLRKAYVDGIEMTMGVEGDAAMQQLQAGSADVLFDLTPSPANITQLKAANDKNFSTMTNGGVDQFMWINTKSPNNDGALTDLKVRQALQYAVDKAAVVQTMGGKDLAGVTNGIFGPGILGYEEYDPYPANGGKGDPEKAKELLAEAGFPDGITLKMPYRNVGTQPDIAQTVQDSLKKAGITLELTPVPPTDYYANFMTNVENATTGKWDVALVGWSPDWQGGAARSVFQPQFVFTGTAQAYNYVDYNSDKANELAEQALAASTAEESGALWHQVDEAVMTDSPIVSIAYRLKPNYHSSRVAGFTPYAQSQNGDWTNLWLTK